MSKYLKMAGVFKLPLMHFNDDGSIGGVNDSDGDAVIYIRQSPSCMTSSERDNRAIYAAHAINSHDELVAMNQELLEALVGAQSLLEHYGKTYDHSMPDYSEFCLAEQVIAKTKGQ